MLIGAGFYAYSVQRKRQRLIERLEFGFEQQEEQITSLWEGATNLLQLAAIRQLLLSSALIRALDIMIRRAGLRISLLQSIAVLIGITLISALLMHFLYRNNVATVSALLAAPFLTVMIWRFLAERQQRKMDLQLPSLINSMLTTMRAGGTPIQALQATSRNADDPMRKSVTQVLNQLQIGQSPIMVWKEWSDFWDTKPCRLLSTGIRVKWEAGGQMTSVLEHILESIEFRKKIQERIDTLTTQAKFGSILLSVIPPLLLYMQYRVRPELVTEMFDDPTGQKIYIAAGVLTTIGFFWLRKMAKIKME
ncbi:type II secretion system F family protein [Methylophilus aquaticus]|uniref:Type II secretion system F family protein n=1 Tax=Methylophilus aquaticus TaxID=1971610 RepID=A0ABT9JP85_9PROT|nr:type II secretion system F family protein [Methylophilus aquaticus]MDP8566390.1 type II secretion system F family protein [Methylophilus aquaticus]